MKIVDILIESAQLLGLNDEFEILHDATTENENVVLENEKILKMFNLLKYSIRELCSNYVPVTTDCKISTVDMKYPVGALTNFIRVQNVFENGEVVKFKIINRNIVFERDGEYVVRYSTYPEILTMFDEIDFLQSFSPDVMVLGLCAYFSLAYGMFTEFEEFHEKYISKAESIKTLRVFDLPCRRWE